MFWSKKESKDGLPDLPPLKSPISSPFMQQMPRKEAMPEDEADESASSHALPSFPDSPIQKSFSQTAIKDAITQPMSSSADSDEEDEEEENEGVGNPSRIKTMEMDSPEIPQKEKAFTLEEPPKDSYVPPKKPASKVNEIFVKVDHFNSAHRSITAIRKKIDDIDSALKRIREIKMREEQELASWEKEISSLKGRLQEVSDTLFE